MIECVDVSFSYPVPRRYRDVLMRPFAAPHRMPALVAISLKIEVGSRVALLGCNGAGKTTLLKLIGGLLYPTTGQVRVAGIDTVKCNLQARHRVGFVINEERSFYWRLTGLQNLDFFGVLNDLHGRSLRTRIHTLLEEVGLRCAMNKRVSDYSAGMRQRLAIARGLLCDPDVLLLDEPTKSLDPAGANQIRALINTYAAPERHRTLIMTTNQMNDVVDLCDHLCVLERGHMVAHAPLDGRTEEDLSTFYTNAVEASP
jgi:ABC-2 type transport system ATP-binding protein